jgi:hypothetical protein
MRLLRFTIIHPTRRGTDIERFLALAAMASTVTTRAA